MELLYGKNFSKDLDALRHETKIKAQLLKLIEVMRAAESLTDLKGVRKIEGYQAYFRIKVADYRPNPSPYSSCHSFVAIP